MTPTATQRGSQTREKLLDAAVDVITEHGWAAATTRVIADRAGINAGLVHYHFGSVEDLRVEATLRALAEVGDPPMTALADAEDLSEALPRLIASMQGHDHAATLTTLLLEATLAATRDESVREALEPTFRAYREAVRDLLAKRGVVNAAHIGDLVLAALDGLFLHAALFDPYDVAATAAPLGQLLEERS